MKTIGFKTKSQRSKELKASSIEEDKETITCDTFLQAETIERIDAMNNYICGKEFQKLADEDKQRILLDFSYYSKVSAIIS